MLEVEVELARVLLPRRDDGGRRVEQRAVHVEEEAVDGDGRGGGGAVNVGHGGSGR
jgi:hypothetical protein